MTTSDLTLRSDISALFIPEGECLVPTAFAVGPWRPDALHGGAVYVLEYTNANGGPDEGWLPRVRKLGRDGQVTTLATIPRQR